MRINISMSIQKIEPLGTEKVFVTEGCFKAEVVDGGCKITKYEGTDEKLVIPDSICGKQVVTLGICMFGNGRVSRGSGVYHGNETAESITIPAGVIKIEPGTFIGCHPKAIHVDSDNQYYTSIDGVLFDKQKHELIRYPIEREDKSYSVPKGVEIIRDHAFYGCLFEELILPDGLLRIEDEAMHECHSLKSIDIPQSVNFIGFNAFCNCPMLKNALLPGNNTTIDDCAFWDCYLDEVIIPNGVVEIGRDAFYGCKIKNVIIPESVKTLGTDAFPNGTKITFSGDHPIYYTKQGVLFNKQKNSLVRYPSNSKRQTYIIPDGITEIESCAFSHCENLQSIALPDGIKTIGMQAFNMCFSLERINIPASVTQVGKEAFRYCKALVSIDFPEGIAKIAEHMFNWCKALKNVTIPSSVVSIEKSAFGWCDSLDNIVIPDSVVKIEYSAFCDCKSLTHIVIPNSVTNLDAHVFKGCRKLTEIVLSSNLTVINSSLFEGCKSLKRIEIPNGVRRILGYAFMGCKSLELIYIPPSVKEIGPGVFSGCIKLREITGNERFVLEDGVLFNTDKTLLIQYLRKKKGGYSIPATITEVRHGAFHHCDKLTEISIPASVTVLSCYPFRYCATLTKILVDEKNLALATIDGVLFNKDKTVLMQYPIGKNNTNTPFLSVLQ